MRHFFENTYRPERMLNTSQAHLRGMRDTFRWMRECFGRDVTLAEQSDALVADLLAWLIQRRGVTAVTANHHRAHWFAVWRYAGEKGHVPRDPRLRKLKEQHDEPDAWTADETRRLLAAADRLTGFIGQIPAHLWWRCLFSIGWYTALRRGTLLAIRRRDVDLDTGWLHVPPAAMKNNRGKKYRLGTDALAAIRTVWLPERELLLPWPIDPHDMGGQFNLLLQWAQIPKSRRRSGTQTHKLRRTVATEAAVRRGLAAAIELLGHSGPEVTKRYIDPSKLPGNDATQYLPPLVPRDGGSEQIDYLDKAQRLLAEGDAVMAAAAARIVLERKLQAVCRSHGVKPMPPGGLSGCTDVLWRRGIIDREDTRLLRRLANVANSGAHGRDISAQRTGELLAALGVLLSSDRFKTAS